MDELRRARDRLAGAVSRGIENAQPEPLILFGSVDSTLGGPPRVAVVVTGYGTLRCRYPATYSPAPGDYVALHLVASGVYYCTGKVAT